MATTLIHPGVIWEGEYNLGPFVIVGEPSRGRQPGDVTTRIGAEGIALEHGVDAEFADDPATFAAAVLRLLAAPDDAARLGAAAREKAVARYDWDAIGAPLGALYSDLAARARQR